jgi:acyl transferase domain-containing protein/acyl carrier protein
LEAEGAPSLGDAAYTLQVGRRAFKQRVAVVCRDRQQAAAALRANDPRAVLQSVHETSNRPVAFMFPGVGDHYVGMAAGLYADEPTFRQEVDRCAEILKPLLGCDLREVIYAGQPRASNGEPATAAHLNLRGMLGRGRARADARAERLNETIIAQPAVFVVEYALARLLMEWGVQPQAMIGYSIGEYVAACLAGVFSLEDALSLVAGRARMIQALPGGAMLAVSLSEEEVRPDLNERLWLAAVNGPALCVVAGADEAVEAYSELLLGRDVACRRLPTTHAFHSGMMEPIVKEVTDLAARVRLYAPQLGYISNVTGAWIDAADAADPAYWARHMRQPVRFADGLRELWREPGRILLEVGPGQSLTSLALQQRPGDAAHEGVALPTMRTPYEQQADEQFLLGTAAKLWLAGYPLDWERTHQHKPRRRVPLPTYSFDRRYYWLPQTARASSAGMAAALTKKPEVTDWFYIPSWKRERPLASLKPACDEGKGHTWLLFLDAGGIGARVASLLTRRGHEVITVTAGESFARVAARSFQIDPSRPEDYERLIEEQHQLGLPAARVVHLWGLDPRREGSSERDWFEEAQEVGFHSLLHLARTLGRTAGGPVQVAVVTDRIQDVTGEERLTPEMSTVLGPCKVIPQEYPDITCRNVDVALNGGDAEQVERLAHELVNELLAGDSVEAVAHRGGYRWVQNFESLKLRPASPAARLREGGTYVLFGGLGRIGLTLAEYLWVNARARLVLTGRNGLPPREEWDEWLAQRGQTETAFRIRKVQDLEAAGAEVYVHAADVTDLAQMREAMRQTREQFGDPRGVVYLAGLLGAASFCPIQETTRAEAAIHFAPKAHGLYVLEEVLEGLELDFCVLFSSLSSVLGGLGFTAYAAANVFIDTFVRRHNRRRAHWLSEDWDTWLVREGEPRSLDFKSTQSELNMTPEQGQAAFAALLAAGDLTQVVVSVGDLQTRLNRWIRREPAAVESAAPPAPNGTSHPRPGLHNAFVAPRSETEQAIADIWQEVLGIKPIGVHDSFFGLGGHSLLGTQVISRIRKKFQEDISVRTFFSSPTVADLAEAVVQKRLERVDSTTLAQLITDVRLAGD